MSECSELFFGWIFYIAEAIGRDEFFYICHIDTIETGCYDRRRRDADMDFCWFVEILEGLDEVSECGPSHDTVIHEHDFLSLEKLLQVGIEDVFFFYLKFPVFTFCYKCSCCVGMFCDRLEPDNACTICVSFCGIFRTRRDIDDDGVCGIKSIIVFFSEDLPESISVS